MADNIGKIGGPAMMRLVVDDEVSDDTTVKPSQREVIRKSIEPEGPGSGGARGRKRKSPPAEQVSQESEELEPTEALDGPVEDAGEPEGEEAAGEAATAVEVDLGVLEALLFSTHHPLTAGKLADLMELPTQSPLRHAIKALNAGYEEARRAFRIEQVAGGYQMLTLPEYGEHLKALHQKEVDSKLTKAAIETLAIIAYKQPILRADVEAIRGVACGETIRSLMEKHLVRIAGRAEEPGRPILYGTTKRFLELFGLNTLKDLPQGQELQLPK
jgi:segregation and condensation protein B